MPLLSERNAVDGAALGKKSVLFVGNNYTYVNNLPNDTNTYNISILNEEKDKKHYSIFQNYQKLGTLVLSTSPKPFAFYKCQKWDCTDLSICICCIFKTCS